ncbi:MAG: hypothetical protein KY469_21450, partial [Actinobacteria bacterium]|nr:hypothetical protein [Actinomycetota bacterium]
ILAEREEQSAQVAEGDSTTRERAQVAEGDSTTRESAQVAEGGSTTEQAAAPAEAAPETAAEPEAPAEPKKAEIHVEDAGEIDQETYDALIAEGKSERIARAKAKAAYVRKRKQELASEGGDEG